MAQINFVTKDNLLYVWQKIKLKLSGKVDKVEGKGLSTNDLTDELKAKILSAGDSSFSGNYNDLTNKPDLSVYGNKIESVKVNGVAQTVTEKAVNIAVPTNNNQLTNGAGYQTASQVETAISAKGYQTANQVNTTITGKGYQTASQVSTAITNAIAGVTQFDYSIVTSLPATGKKGTIYLVANSGTGNNVYDEYLWLNDKWELFGTTQVDLTGYLKEEQLVPLTNAEIDEIFADLTV